MEKIIRFYAFKLLISLRKYYFCRVSGIQKYSVFGVTELININIFSKIDKNTNHTINTYIKIKYLV